jgi:hypothetical protein
MTNLATSNVLGPPMPAGLAMDQPVADLRQSFAATTKANPVDKEAKAAFMRSKLRLAHTHPAASTAARNRSVSSVARSLSVDELADAPVPGGVGAGFFYSESFKHAWDGGTSIRCDFVCPTPPGGNVNTWLYLTATNRSGMGVEAFVLYYGQNEMYFRIFDWARGPDDYWQTNIPLAQLAPYLASSSAHGHPHQTLTIWNSTAATTADKTSWENSVLLFNHQRGGWDQVYSFAYAATDSEQKDVWVGSWGPIVETFQDVYSGTNPMGALQTQLASQDAMGNWGDWALLSDSNSYWRTDNKGFQTSFIDPNYAFVVVS